MYLVDVMKGERMYGIIGSARCMRACVCVYERM